MNLPNNPSFIYLHGFASSPQSAKARYLRDRFDSVNINLKIPDLNQGDFSGLTLTRQLQQVEIEIPQPPASAILIGSSFGGLTSAFLAERNPNIERLILLAPAFKFMSHWLPVLGEPQLQKWQREKFLKVFHYGANDYLPLSYDFVADMAVYDEEKIERSLPTLIFHGFQDEVIPIGASREFAVNRPWVELIELDSDHSLGNTMEEIWEAISRFLAL